MPALAGPRSESLGSERLQVDAPGGVIHLASLDQLWELRHVGGKPPGEARPLLASPP